MFFVLIFFTINILFCIWNPSYKNRQIQTIYWAFCVLAIFFIGFRGAIDNDYAAYTAMFSDNSILVEPAFLLIRFLIRDICGGGITGLMFVYAIISVTIKFVAIKRYSEFIFPSLIIWIGNLMILQDMTQIRAAAACGILLLSSSCISDRECPQSSYQSFYALFLIVRQNQSGNLDRCHFNRIPAFAKWNLSDIFDFVCSD